MPMRIMPPRMDALPESFVPNFLPMRRPAMQMKKNSEPLVAATNDAPDISTREREILELLAKGIPFAEIGTILMISPHTVTAHIKKIYRKLQVHSRGEAVYEARALNLISDS